MATQTEIINIVVREDGSRVVKRNIENIGGAANKAGDMIGRFKTLLAGIVGGTAINQLRQLADQYTNIQNRLRLTTTDQANLNAVFNELQAISTRTRSALDANVELYSRLSVSAKDLGLSQQDVLQFTESLNQAIKISGATASEAEGGIRQLSQGLASGALRGDELVSVLENLPAVADVIAKSLGVTRGELRKLGAEGKITANTVVNAFREARVELAEKFAKTTPTAAEGFVLLRNQLVETVGAIDQAVGGSSALGAALQSVTKFLKDITPILVNVTRAVTGTLDPTDEMSKLMKQLATVLVVVEGVVRILATSLSATLGVALRTTGRLLTGVVEAIVAAVNGDFAGAGEALSRAWEGTVTDVVDSAAKLRAGLTDEATKTITKLDQIWNEGARTIQDRQKLAVGTVGTERGVNNTVGPSEEELKKQQREMEKVRRELTSLLGTVDPLGQATLKYAKDHETLIKAWEKGLITMEQLTQYQQILAAQYAAQQDPLSKLNTELEEQMRLLGLSAREREIEAQVLAATRELQSQGVILTQQETEALREKFRALQELTRQTQIQDQLLASTVEQRQGYIDQLRAMTDLMADPTSGFTNTDAIDILSQQMPELFEGTQEMIDLQLTQFDYYYEQIKLMREADIISAETAAQMKAKIEQKEFDLRLKNTQTFFSTLAGLAQSGNSKIAKIGQAAALVQATIDAASAVMKAYASAPYPANIALAAAQAALSAVQISKIASANTGFATGGEFRVGGSGGTDSQMVAFRATPGERVAVSTPQQVRKGDPNSFGGGGGEPVQVSGPTIINVRDPKEIPNAIQSSDGKDAIINVISNNAATFREILKQN